MGTLLIWGWGVGGRFGFVTAARETPHNRLYVPRHDGTRIGEKTVP